MLLIPLNLSILLKLKMLNILYMLMLGFLSGIVILTILLKGWLGQNLKYKTEYILNNKSILNRILIIIFILNSLISILMNISITIIH